MTLSKRIAVVAWLAILTPVVATAQVVDPQNVLIRNVHLIEPGKEGEPVIVNILIKNNVL